MDPFMGNLPADNGPEGARVPDNLPEIVDAHVHLFPDELFEAIWTWFDNFAWPIRYKMRSEEVVEFMLSRGVQRIVGLHYAHRPGIARDLNLYMAGLCREYPEVIGSATVFPGESGTREILKSAFDMGLSAVKLHAHVQYFSLDSPGMHEIYQVCAEHGKPLVMHVGKAPKNPVFPYKIDPDEICGAKHVEPVLRQYPELKVLVPHLGADEFDPFQRLTEQYDNLWLDVAMAIADYLPVKTFPQLQEMRLDRILYGTDFPHLPYAWDRELKYICTLDLSEKDLQAVLGGNALGLFSG
ncbi:amidohydrolase family protein [Desulfomonile tiedjei]|uniref:Putative TIM-barrel fold metal-dependent hydrolase n=1 Tax=Desulfomonile tiedjei (strain ATCC 49306 / DSM 6799 / DCB-1) TaxID=706587 RepID=I4C6E9_DESTA|nr:amidohydrolase family protein [Desulfomonile tiedjei]AFM25140.1 putative TIM-barrel fold metal-dependent hydrolase [Desulfomonile tiedjei DSM 6799]